jgi:tetratricopeptide (TPR) repeat protein
VLASVDKALAIRSDSIEALNQSRQHLQALGRFEEALACLDKAVAIRPDYPASLNNRGNVLRCLGRLNDALADFEKALAIAPDFADAHLNERLCPPRAGFWSRLGKGRMALANAKTRTV